MKVNWWLAIVICIIMLPFWCAIANGDDYALLVGVSVYWLTWFIFAIIGAVIDRIVDQ